MIDYFYYLCEHYGSKISNWAWRKRWNNHTYRLYKVKNEKKIGEK